MKIDLDDLEAKAQHDLTSGSSRRSKPARVILDLVAEVRRLESRLRQVREQRDAWQKIARSQPIPLEPAGEPEPDGE